ncbi:MAG TPA: MarR family transcriptional regulator [Aggregatilineales bacterium]|nr:MarR family transcriptional regulator [Aggregatilineales bacterium]
MINYPETVGFNLVKLCKMYFNTLNTMLGEVGLYEGQHHTLMQLWESDGLPQAELIQRLGVEPASVSKAIERMENAGIVQRQPDPEDARANCIFLTEKGRSLEEPVRRILAESEERLLATMSVEERLLLRRLLLQMRENLK